MNEFFCARCGYFLFAVEQWMTQGRVRTICRACRKHDLVDLASPPITPEEARARRAGIRATLRLATA